MLRKRLLQTIEKSDKLTQGSLAKIAGVTEPTISRYLNEIEELGFEHIQKLINHFFKEKEREYMAEYALTQELQNARGCLEYCSINGMHDISAQLIERLANSRNRTDREWAKTYQFALTITLKKPDIKRFLTELEQFLPKFEEMKILKTIIKCHALFELDKHKETIEHLHDISNDIDNLNSEFIKKSFQTRVGLILNYIYLYSNKIEEARETSNRIIEQEIAENVKAGAHINLGHSYLFEDYQKSKYHYDLAIEYFIKRERTDLVEAMRYTISFLQSYYRLDREYVYEGNSYQEKSDYVFYLIQKGDMIKAKELLLQTNINDIPDWNKGFYYFYLGLIENTKDSLYEAVKWYRATSNFFHLQLPIQALRALGEHETVLDIFTTQ